MVDKEAADQVKACLGTASESKPPSECKDQITKLVDLGKPQVSKLLGEIKVAKEEVTIPDDSVGPIIRRTDYTASDKLDGDKNRPGCIVSFGLRIPSHTDHKFKGLDVSGIEPDTKLSVYNCSPSPTTSDWQIKTANFAGVNRKACSGQVLGWTLSEPIIAVPNTQPFGFVLQVDSSDSLTSTFEVNLKITADPRNGGSWAQAQWKLSGQCQ